VTSQSHLWAETYDRRIEGIFAIQSDIAEEVATNLQVKLGLKHQGFATKNLEAYNLYLKALFLFNQGSRESFFRSIEMLKQSIALDPQFGAAYAVLADYSNSLIWMSDISPGEAHRQAREYAEKALTIDDTLARAHVALADARMYGRSGLERRGIRISARNRNQSQLGACSSAVWPLFPASRDATG
jgi:hypothetical protein